MITPKLLSCLVASTTGLLSLLTPVLAQDADYTATGIVVSAEAPGLVFGTGGGGVVFRNNTHTARVTATDPRLTGRRRVVVDGAYHADGTAELSGFCYQEVGTWNDAAFTPSGGVWEIRYVGTLGVDNSLQVRLTGTGIGAAIDGLRMTETMTRGPAAAPVDPGQPYRYTGRILAAPAVSRRVVDDFQGLPPSAWTEDGTGQRSLTSTDGTLVVRGNWPGTRTLQHIDTWCWGSRRVNWEVADGQSLEWRVDLLGMTAGSTNAAGLAVGSASRIDCYLFYKGVNYIQLAKYDISTGLRVLSHDNVQVRNTNVVLSLVMTRVQSNLILTCRVLDKEDPETVLCQRNVVDTPQADRTVTQDELLAASGMNLRLASDQAGPPLSTGDSVSLLAWQYTDGSQPALEVGYDNLEVRSYEAPRLGLEPSVTLLVPASCDLEQSPGVNQPWTPVVESAPAGIQRISVPVRGPSALFRAVPKP